MLQYYIELELATQNYGNDALSLLSFPEFPLLPADFSIKLNCRSKGRAKTKKIPRERLITEILKYETFNSLAVDYKFASYAVPRTGFSLADLQQTFSLSPTSTQWAATSTWEHSESLTVSREMSTQLSFESMLMHNGVTIYPSILDCLFALEVQSSPEQVAIEFAAILAEVLTKLDLPADISGGGGIMVFDKEICNIKSTSSTKMQWILSNYPGASIYVGKRLVILDTIMVGAIESCSGIAKALGNEVILFPYTPLSGKKYAVLYLPDKIVKSPESALLAAEYLLPLNEETMNIGRRKHWRREQ